MASGLARKLMFMEPRSQAIGGQGRIGWVEYISRCGVYHYRGAVLRKSEEGDYNCFDAGSGEPYLVTAPKYNGRDKLNGGLVEIDEDAREEYWQRIRRQPACIALTSFRAGARRGR